MGVVTKVLIGLVLALGLLAIWQRGSVAKARMDAASAEEKQQVAEQGKRNADAQLAQTQHVLDIERARAVRAQEIADQFEKRMRDAQAKGDAVAAGVLAGDQRLQQRWAGCETARLSEAVASASQPDAGAADRAASAGRIVAAAAACDAQVRGLQAIVSADRTPVTQ